MMKKEYMKPVMDIYLVSPSPLLAGSLNAGDQNDPTMAPEFDGFDEIMSLQSDDPLNLFGF